MKRRPCRGKFEKDTLMVMIWHERKDAGKLDRTLFEVPCDDKSIADCVQEKFKKRSTNFIFSRSNMPKNIQKPMRSTMPI